MGFIKNLFARSNQDALQEAAPDSEFASYGAGTAAAAAPATASSASASAAAPADVPATPSDSDAGEAGAQTTGNGLGNTSIGELDWNGKVVWQWGTGAQEAYGSASVASGGAPGGTAKQHHDWRRLANGNTLVLANLVHSVPGFQAAQVLDDVIYEVTPSGSIAWKWVVSEHLEEFGFSPEALKLVRAA
eukprot:gene35072-43243_t